METCTKTTYSHVEWNLSITHIIGNTKIVHKTEMAFVQSVLNRELPLYLIMLSMKDAL